MDSNFGDDAKAVQDLAPSALPAPAPVQPKVHVPSSVPDMTAAATPPIAPTSGENTPLAKADVTVAAKFTEDAKRAARAAKFGIPVKTTSGAAADSKLAARAARFSMTEPVPGGAAPSTESAELLEKKKLRAERFGIDLKTVSQGYKAGGRTPPNPMVDEAMVGVLAPG